MIRKLVIMLALLPGLLFAQQVDYIMTPLSQPQLEYLNQANGQPLGLADDSVTTVSLPFSFSFFGQQFETANISSNGVVSFKNAINGCCGGYLLSEEWFEYGIFALQTDLINIYTSNPYYKTIGEEGSRKFVIGWYDMPVFYDPSNRSTFEITLFEGTNNIMLSYGDVSVGGRPYTAGIKGSGPEQYIQLYYGSDSSVLDYTSWLFASSTPEPPPPEEPDTPIGVDCVLYPADSSCIIDTITDVPEQPVVVDNQPAEQPIEEDPIEPEINSDEVEEQLVVEDQPREEAQLEQPQAVAELVDEQKASELVDTISKDVLEGALAVAIDSSSANTSSSSTPQQDSQSQSTRTTASLSVSSGLATTQESTQSESKAEEAKTDSADSVASALDILETGRLIGAAAMANIQAAAETSAVESTQQAELISILSAEQQTQQSTATGPVVSSMVEDVDSKQLLAEKTEIEQIAIPVVIAVEEEQKIDGDQPSTIVLSQVEVVEEEPTVVATNNEVVSVNESAVMATEEVVSSEVVIAEVQEEVTVSDEIKDEQQVTEQVVEVTTEQQDSIVVAENSAEAETQAPIIVAQTTVEPQEESAETLTVESTAMELEQINTFSEIIQLEIAPVMDQKDEDVEYIQSVVMAEQNKETESITGLSEDETITIAADPNLANAFNLQPTNTTLEQAGLLNQKQEEKSDAEKRADEVVAANKEQQEEISKNYMDADQSGLVAAIGSNADFTNYKSVMIQDNTLWYKPEDIYKNITYKDNARGMYFLEKGNTDTYKQMVEDQYK